MVATISDLTEQRIKQALAPGRVYIPARGKYADHIAEKLGFVTSGQVSALLDAGRIAVGREEPDDPSCDERGVGQSGGFVRHVRWVENPS